MAVQADNSGIVRGSFQIPEGVPAGVKAMEMIGERGSRAVGQFIGRGTINVFERRRLTTVERYDPLAQTFTLLGEGRHLAAVGLWFQDIGDKPVTVQIRSTQTGLPTGEILAEVRLERSQIKPKGEETVARFALPLYFEGGVEYAVVILTDDNQHSLAIAEVGQYDQSAKRYITEQGYSVGVLLSSSNASTWTPHNNADLKFRLYGAKFEPTREIDLGVLNLDNTTDLRFFADIERQSALTQAQFALALEAGTDVLLNEQQPMRLQQKTTGDKALSLKLKGTPTQSPIVYTGAFAFCGQVAERADYISRAVVAGSGEAIVVLESLAPSGSAVSVEIEINGVWQATSPQNGEPLGDGWIRQEYKQRITGGSTVRVKITLTGTAKSRPKARNLRMITT